MSSQQIGTPRNEYLVHGIERLVSEHVAENQKSLQSQENSNASEYSGSLMADIRKDRAIKSQVESIVEALKQAILALNSNLSSRSTTEWSTVISRYSSTMVERFNIYRKWQPPSSGHVQYGRPATQ